MDTDEITATQREKEKHPLLIVVPVGESAHNKKVLRIIWDDMLSASQLAKISDGGRKLLFQMPDGKIVDLGLHVE